MNGEAAGTLAARIVDAAKAHPDVRDALVLDRGDGYDLAVVPHSITSAAEIRMFVFTAVGEVEGLRSVTLLSEVPDGVTDDQLAKLVDAAADVDKSVYIEPADETERELVLIWQRVLQVDRIGVVDDFIDLGGESVAVMELDSAIKERFGVELEAFVILDEGNVRNLATRIRQHKSALAGEAL
jgi:acyl carrier protein